MSNYDYLIKCLIIGDSGTGKSSIMIRLVDDKFNTNYISTIGVDFKIKTMNYKDKTFKFQIWDTAGQDRFRTITSSYYRGADTILLCYDITDRKTFINLDKWLEEVKMYSLGEPIIFLCGNKLDLEITRNISRKEGEEYAKSKNMIFFETSSKNNVSIKEIFNFIAEDKINKTTKLELGNYNNDYTKYKTVEIELNNYKKNKKTKKNSCC